MSAHVHITHAVCARHLRYVYTHAPFLPCLYTYGRLLTEPTIGDGLTRLRRLETVWVRSPHVQTECLHEATTRDGVCTQKCETHAPARINATLQKPRAHDFFHWVCTCLTVRLSAYFILACPIFYFNLNLYILDIFILLLLYFSLCNKYTL